MPLGLDEFLALPRLATLHLSPDGRRLVATAQQVSADGKRFAGALWEIDPAAERAPRRLTFSAKGETCLGFLPDGSLLFVSPRPDVESAEGAGKDLPALYLLPAEGGEPHRVMAPDGGLDGLLTARGSATVVAVVPLHPGARGLEEDAAREKARGEAGVEALLFERYPMHWWDHTLGGRAPHLLALDLSDPQSAPPPARDLTPDVPWHGWMEDTGWDLSADATFLVGGARQTWGREMRVSLVRLDLATGDCRTLLDDPDTDHDMPTISPDGRWIACVRSYLGHPDDPGWRRLSLVDAQSGEVRDLAPDWDASYAALSWTPDSAAVLVTGDERGHNPIFRVDLDGRVTRLTASGAYSDVRAAPDGDTLYALRSHLDAPPTAVVLDAHTPDQAPRALRGPGEPLALDSQLEEVTAQGPDGAEIHAWLVLPAGASAEQPAPLALFVHGGPFASFHGWSWRWCPQVLAGEGYAVLLPNPRLSTGYGRAHVDAAWTDWATLPFADLMACVDAAAARSDVDGERLAAMGGSYGGYMANWIAGHTDRFRAVITHASLWSIEQMWGTTDFGPFLERELGPPGPRFETWLAQSPHLSVDEVRTPMLVIHGDRDRRVPSSEAVRLWADLQLRNKESRLLWFPDENHWILKPQNARLWYQTVLAFLDHHVRGRAWQKPELL